jgi:uncharacterized tellurite resistance protein B-like protein
MSCSTIKEPGPPVDDWPVSRTYLPRWRRRSGSRQSYCYQRAALRMQLLVAMAASDERVQMGEVDSIAQLVDDMQLRADEVKRLDQLLRMLLEAPPQITDLLEQLVQQMPSRRVAEAFASDLAHIAYADGHIDEREERLLRLLCGAFGIEPRTLHDASPVALADSEREELRVLLASITAA